MESVSATVHSQELARPLRPAEQIVEFLSVASAADPIPCFRQWNQRDWTRTLRWLDDSGLAFYFLRRAKERNITGSMPPWVCTQLETNFVFNHQRTEEMWRRFSVINERFSAACIPFIVLKGFSLPPDYCASCALRYQGDLDYLIDKRSLPQAQEVLIGLGYSRKDSRSRQEVIFLSPNAVAPQLDWRQYSPHAPHAVELHFDMWDASLYGLCRLPKLFSVGRASMRSLNDSVFPALNDEDGFLLQVLHACHHLFTHWIRISSFVEIAYFLERRADDHALWYGIERKVESDVTLREFVVIVVEMARRLFACPVPDLVLSWNRGVRAETRLWLDQYSRQWAFSDVPVHRLGIFPGSKLVLFLQRQYRTQQGCNPEKRETTKRSWRPFRMVSSVMANPRLLFDRRWWRKQALIRRTAFHILAGLRYACEIPRWRWRLRKMRATARPGRETMPPLQNSTEIESP